MLRDKSFSFFLLESAWLLETHRKTKSVLLYSLLCKHKTVATLEPIRGVSLLTYINEGGTTLRRPFEDVVFIL